MEYDGRRLLDSTQSVSPEKADARLDDERLPADHYSRRKELIKLEVATIKLVSKKGARLVKSTFLSPGQPSPGLCRSLPSLRVSSGSIQDIGGASSVPNLRIDGLGACSPLLIAHSTLNQLWGANDAITRAGRILDRARRRKMASDRTSTTVVAASATDLRRRSCPPVDVNWFTAKRRSELPSWVGTDPGVLQDRRRTLQAISELSPEIMDLEWRNKSSCAEYGDRPTASDNGHNRGTHSNGNISSNGRMARASQTSLYKCNLHRHESLVFESHTSSPRHKITGPSDWKGGAPKDLGVKFPFDTEHLTVAFSLRGKSRASHQGHSSDYAGPSKIANDYVAPLNLGNPSNQTPIDGTGRSQYYGDVVRQKPLIESSLRRYISSATMGSSRQPGQAIERGPFRSCSQSPLCMGCPSSFSVRDSFHNSPTMDRNDTKGNRDLRPLNKPKGPSQSGAIAKSNEGYAQNIRGRNRNGIESPVKNGHQDNLSRDQSAPPNETSDVRAIRQSHSMRLFGNKAPYGRLLANHPSDPEIPEAGHPSPILSQPPSARAGSRYSNMTSNTLGSNRPNIPIRLSSRLRRPDSTQRRRREIAKAQTDAIAALTAAAPVPSRRMTPECLALLDSQRKKLEDKIQTASVAYDRDSRLAYREDRKSSKPTSRKLQISCNPNIKMVNTDSSSVQANVAEKGEDNEKQDTESSRILREKDRLSKWRAAKEKIEPEETENDRVRAEPARPQGIKKKKNRFRKLKTSFMEFLFCGDYQA